MKRVCNEEESNKEEGKKIVGAKRRKGKEDVLEAGASNRDLSTCCRLHAPRLMRAHLTTASAPYLPSRRHSELV